MLLLGGPGFAILTVKKSPGSGYVVHSDVPMMCYRAWIRVSHFDAMVLLALTV